MAGNGIAGADEIAHGNVLGGILNLIGAGSGIGAATSGLGETSLLNPLGGTGGGSLVGNAAGDVADKAIGASGLGSGAADLASNLVRGVGTVAQDVGTQAAAPAILDPILQRTLGISQGGAPPTTPTQNMSPKTTGGGGGAGPSSGPGGLNISGGTAPQIYPYTKQSSGGSTGAQPQARGI